MKEYKIFISYVIPSVLAFALSGIYAIVDGFLLEIVWEILGFPPSR